MDATRRREHIDIILVARAREDLLPGPCILLEDCGDPINHDLVSMPVSTDY